MIVIWAVCGYLEAFRIPELLVEEGKQAKLKADAEKQNPCPYFSINTWLILIFSNYKKYSNTMFISSETSHPFSLAGSLVNLRLLTDSSLQMVAIIADETLVVKPVETVFELATVVFQVILFITSFTGVSLIFQTALNITVSSFQLVMSHTVDALSSWISETTVSHLLASVVLSQVEPALTMNTAVVI